MTGAILVPGLSLGQGLETRVRTLEQQMEEQRKGVGAALGIDFHALVAGNYTYNFNSPDSKKKSIRVWDYIANTFVLEQASLFISRQKEDESLGFSIITDFGEQAERLGRATDWDGSGVFGDSSEETNYFDLREAYLTYKLPIGDGVKLKAGKFVTILGYEVINNWDNFNPTISRPLLFGYAIAFTHTGLLASFPLGDYVNVDVGLVNGWDNFVDNNDGKTGLLGVGFNPNEDLSFYWATSYGPEQNPTAAGGGGAGSKRFGSTLVGSWGATDELSFVVEGDYLMEDNVPGAAYADGFRDADWYGAAGYIIYQPGQLEGWSFVLRTEVFADPDGYRTGVQEPGYAPGVTIWDITPAVAYQVTDNLTWRFEYRHDEADRKAFGKDSHLQRGQDTVNTQLIYAF
jgi:hypothetical protein